MPSRWISWAIIGFWLATTGWMVYREASLRQRAGEPPPFTIDLTDEVSASTISWSVWQNGQRVGDGLSSVKRRAGRTFELASQFRFTDLQLRKQVDFQKVESMYRINAAGELLGLEAKVSMRGIDVRIEGRIEAGYLIPRVFVKLGTMEEEFPVAEKTKVAGHGSLLNPMHLLNKVVGLRAGLQWPIRLLDPVIVPLPGQKLTIPILEAETTADLLNWNGQEVPCFKIEYHEPGKKPTARTWVRQRDGVVLQQEARHLGMEIVLRRGK